MANGRFAPSPTGDLHIGNLRTALVAWLFARTSGSAFTVRMEDLDRVTSSAEHAASQLNDLETLGLDWDGEVVFQSDRFDRYFAAVDHLTAAGLTYPCFCSRREIAEAASAPHEHLPEGAYPGTCRELTETQRGERYAERGKAALRLRADHTRIRFEDTICGSIVATVDDFVLRRADGVPAYNLAVVVDDAAQHVEEVVRADDLLLSTPRQMHLGQLLKLRPLSYAHIPLVLSTAGVRLAKRDGAVTLKERLAGGDSVNGVLSLLAQSLGMAAVGELVELDDLLYRFDPAAIPHDPWVFDPVYQIDWT
jgi:glutamyl-tRNA synthetase